MSNDNHSNLVPLHAYAPDPSFAAEQAAIRGGAAVEGVTLESLRLEDRMHLGAGYLPSIFGGSMPAFYDHETVTRLTGQLLPSDGDQVEGEASQVSYLRTADAGPTFQLGTLPPKVTAPDGRMGVTIVSLLRANAARDNKVKTLYEGLLAGAAVAETVTLDGVALEGVSTSVREYTLAVAAGAVGEEGSRTYSVRATYRLDALSGDEHTGRDRSDKDEGVWELRLDVEDRAVAHARAKGAGALTAGVDGPTE